MSDNRIPILDLQPEIQAHWDEFNKAIQSVLSSGMFVLGPEVTAFEDECAKYLDVKHAIGCNSGTDALIITLRSLGIGCGDEVITTPFTFVATAEAITLVNATPVFVDIEPDTLNIDVSKIEAAITDKTKAIMPVHLFGHAVDMDALLAIAKKHNLKVIEDTAQAFGGAFNGEQLGTMGNMGAYSFFPTKNLGAFGDAGLMTTDDDELAERARMIRVHGSRQRYHNEVVGYNSRLDSLQACVLRIKLRYLDESNAGRRRVADGYREGFAELEDLAIPAERSYTRHVYHQYTVRIKNGKRDAVAAAMNDAGVSTMIYYPIPVHQQKMYNLGHLDLPETNKAAEEVLSLPIWPQMSESVQQRVIKTLCDAIRKK